MHDFLDQQVFYSQSYLSLKNNRRIERKPWKNYPKRMWVYMVYIAVNTNFRLGRLPQPLFQTK